MTNLINELTTTNNRSAKYQHQSTIELLNKLEPMLKEKGMTYYKSIARPDLKSTRHVVEYRLNTTMKVLGDEGVPRLIFINSYNGESSLQIKVGFYRMVCSNGLILGTDLFSEKIIHVKGQTFEQKIKQLEVKIAAALEYIKESMADDISEKMGKTLSSHETTQLLDALNISNKVRDTVKDRLEYRALRPEDNTGTVWALYNVVQEEIKQRSRSELSFNVRNVKLMDEFIKLSA